MNFLDPDKWSDLEGLEREFVELDEERVKEMHERLRPYFLRRVKADVLDLPPKVPVHLFTSLKSLRLPYRRMRSLSRFQWPHFKRKSTSHSSVRRLPPLTALTLIDFMTHR